jgi:uncharacterized membrane protein
LLVPDSAKAASGGAKRKINSTDRAVAGKCVVGEVLRNPASSRGLAKRRTHADTLLLACAVITLNAFGNLALASGMKHRELLGLNLLGYISALFEPLVAAGVGLLILWLLTRMALMSWADLSFVVPITAAGYVLSAVLGRVFLAEQVSRKQWLGMALIFAGSVLVGTTPPKTSKPPSREVTMPLAGENGVETT